MSSEHTYDHEQNFYGSRGDDDYQRESRVGDASKRARPNHGRQRGKAPQSVNGIHRRRRRKMSW